ncbi:unnamed protein product, partial [Symbiodinium natans]
MQAPPWRKLPGDTAVLWTLDNPKQLGTAAYDKYEKYKASKTLGEAFAAGVRVIDLNHDYKKGWLRINFDGGTMRSWGPCGVHGVEEFLSSLDLRELGRLLAASRKAADAALCELRHRCQHFEYTGQFASSSRSSWGRAHPNSMKVASRQLVLFLRARQRAFIETLDLARAPLKALEDPGLLVALRSMRSLKKLVLPMDGWESSSKRRAVATALAGIDVGFVFR